MLCSTRVYTTSGRVHDACLHAPRQAQCPQQACFFTCCASGSQRPFLRVLSIRLLYSRSSRCLLPVSSLVTCCSCRVSTVSRLVRLGSFSATRSTLWHVSPSSCSAVTDALVVVFMRVSRRPSSISRFPIASNSAFPAGSLTRWVLVSTLQVKRFLPETLSKCGCLTAWWCISEAVLCQVPFTVQFIDGIVDIWSCGRGRCLSRRSALTELTTFHSYCRARRDSRCSSLTKTKTTTNKRTQKQTKTHKQTQSNTIKHNQTQPNSQTQPDTTKHNHTQPNTTRHNHTKRHRQRTETETERERERERGLGRPMSQNPLHKTPLQPWQRSEVQRWHEELVRTTEAQHRRCVGG